MKALVLAGGKGTRLRPLTNTIAKHVLPVGNKPIICYSLDQIKEAGISDIGIVISNETGPDIQQVVSDGSKWGVRITYILQSPALGLAHAVSVSRGFLENSPFLLFLGDNLIEEGVKDLVAEFYAQPSDALIVLKEVANPCSFGVAFLDASGAVKRLIEKPKEPVSNLALVGAYIFSPAVHQVIDGLRPSPRGEFEITDAIQAMVDSGKNVRSHILKGWWLDTGKKEDLLEANHRVMDEYLKPSNRGEIDGASRIKGTVEIGAGSIIENSRITGPVSIAEGCRVSGSLIGPYTCLGKDTVIIDSSIENSIILEHVSVRDTGRLVDSVIGRNVEIECEKKNQEPVKLFLGDFARVKI